MIKKALFLLVLFVGLFTLSAHVNQQEETAFTINPGKGIGPLIISKSTKKDVELLIGKGKTTDYPAPFGHTTRLYQKFQYGKLGVDIYYLDPSKPKKSDTLLSITVLDPSPLKTPEGLGIGSSKQEVIETLGKPKSAHFSPLIKGYYHAIRYDRVEFVFDSESADTVHAAVEQIKLW